METKAATSTDSRLMGAAAALEAGGRVLVTRLLYLGDAILTLPVVDAIRDRYPNAQVDYLCRKPSSDLLKRDPRFDRVFEVPEEGGFLASLHLVRQLRERKYAAVIDLYTNPRSAWLTRATGARVRIGGDRRSRRVFYTHPVTVPPDVRSAMAHHLSYARLLDVGGDARKPVITLAPEEIDLARGLLDALGIETRRPERPRIGIHAGGKWEVKRWPTRSFAGLIQLLAESWDGAVVVFTGPGEERYTQELRELVGEAAVYAPVLPVRAVASVLSLLDGMVVSDGGIMHLSVAVGTPTVGIFGSAEPDIWFPYERFGPYAPALVAMECRPCHQHVCPLGHTDCLNGLTAESVADTLRGVMAGRRSTVADGDGGGA